MFGWLFGTRDTAESLTREVNSFFDRFQRIAARIEALIAVNDEAVSTENDLHLDTHNELGETRDKTVIRANNLYEKEYATEEERHSLATEKLAVEMETLRKSFRLASKVVKFAEED